jgi:hypothetical protein
LGSGFIRKTFRERLYGSVEAIRKDLDRYFRFYNTKRPPQGCRNLGRRPIDTVKKVSKPMRKEAELYN